MFLLLLVAFPCQRLFLQWFCFPLLMCSCVFLSRCLLVSVWNDVQLLHPFHSTLVLGSIEERSWSPNLSKQTFSRKLTSTSSEPMWLSLKCWRKSRVNSCGMYQAVQLTRQPGTPSTCPFDLRRDLARNPPHCTGTRFYATASPWTHGILGSTSRSRHVLITQQGSWQMTVIRLHDGRDERKRRQNTKLGTRGMTSLCATLQLF